MRRSTNRPLLGQYQATQPIPIPKNKLQQNPNPNPTNPRASESFALEPTPTSTPKINADDRKLRLTAALDARGLAFREDSVLCNDYVMKGRGCIDDIVPVMDQMRFVHHVPAVARRFKRLRWRKIHLGHMHRHRASREAAH
eukprot:4347819-Pyramimonas_sp.AAC.2